MRLQILYYFIQIYFDDFMRMQDSLYIFLSLFQDCLLNLFSLNIRKTIHSDQAISWKCFNWFVAKTKSTYLKVSYIQEFSQWNCNKNNKNTLHNQVCAKEYNIYGVFEWIFAFSQHIEIWKTTTCSSIHTSTYMTV